MEKDFTVANSSGILYFFKLKYFPDGLKCIHSKYFKNLIKPMDWNHKILGGHHGSKFGIIYKMIVQCNFSEVVTYRQTAN